MHNMAGNFFLVGLMGAGKTTISRQLARHFDLDFLDSDHEIEARTGVRIATIFELEGETGFRDREEAIIAELSNQTGIVLATGGGAVLRPMNREHLKTRGTVIYLHANPHDLHQRTRHDKTRPLLQGANPLGTLQALYTERDPLYREIANIKIDTSSQSVHQLFQNLLRQITSYADSPPASR